MKIKGCYLIYGFEIKSSIEELGQALSIYYNPNDSYFELVENLKKEIDILHHLPCCFFCNSKENSNLYIGTEIDYFTVGIDLGPDDYASYDDFCYNYDYDYQQQILQKIKIDNIYNAVKTFTTIDEYEKYYGIKVKSPFIPSLKSLNKYIEILGLDTQTIKFYSFPDNCLYCNN